MCGIYYLAALRAGEEMAKRRWAKPLRPRNTAGLFESGSAWIDANLFNGEFYIQKIRGFAKSEDRAFPAQQHGLRRYRTPRISGRRRLPGRSTGRPVSRRSGRPGAAGLAGRTSRKTLASIYRYNYKRSLATHDTVQRTFALNDEAAMVICDYGKAERPRIPFPYYAEVMTGFEYSTATHMLLRRHGAGGYGECIGNIRARYDGEKRNPWDEAECGHHYARAMAAWSGVLALSGFRYRR
jgi:non-lysosomal glucosylceramidase